MHHKLMQALMRRDRIGGADGGRIARHGERLQPLLAHALDGQRPLALGQRLALGADQEIVMAESGRLGMSAETRLTGSRASVEGRNERGR